MENLSPETKIQSCNCQYLPECVINEIRVKLPAKSVARFRCVSKGWLCTGTDFSFLRAHSRRSSTSLLFKKPLEDPYFDYTFLALVTAAEGFRTGCNTAIKSTLFLPEEFYSIYIELLASCDGLVFLLLFPGFYYVLNPLTSLGTRLPIPPIHFDPFQHNFGFYFHRWAGEYRLLCISATPMKCRYIAHILSLGANLWRRVEEFPPFEYVVQHRSPVCVDDFLYWIGYEASLSEPSVILVFDTRAELFTVMPPPPYQDEREVILREGNLLLGMGLVDIESRLGFYTAAKDKNCTDDLRIDVWVVDDYKLKRWTKLYSVICKQGCCLLGQVDKRKNNHWHTSIAIYVNCGELLLLFDIMHISFLVRCNLKSGKCCADQVFTHKRSVYHPILIYRESLISHDSFTLLSDSPEFSHQAEE